MEMVSCKRLKSQYNNGNEIPRQLMDLPKDLLVEILLRLPVESLRGVRCVSKTLLNTIGSRSFIRRHTLSLITGNNNGVHGVPQLMSFARSRTTHDHYPPSDEEEITRFATLQSLRYDGGAALTRGEYTFTHSRSSPFSADRDYMIQFVFYNLFCMDWNKGPCLLINPLLNQVLTLPTDNILTKYGLDCHVNIWYGMGLDDITNTYKIVRVSRFASKENYLDTLGVLVHILVLGTNSWREIPSLPSCCDLDYFFDNLCAYGDMHWLTLREGAGGFEIISFDFKKEEFYWTPTPSTLGRSNEDSNLHLLALRGSMAVVETSPLVEGGMKIEIWVMKDYGKKEWAREYNINVDIPPRFELKFSTCGEWEHGIFFNDLISAVTTNLFLDLRFASVYIAACPTEIKAFVIFIMSYTGSLISLTDFATYLGNNTDELA